MVWSGWVRIGRKLRRLLGLSDNGTFLVGALLEAPFRHKVLSQNEAEYKEQTFNKLVNHCEEVNVGLVGHDPTAGQDFESALIDQFLETLALNLEIRAASVSNLLREF